MEYNYLILSAWALLLGVMAKYADLFNEHGLKEFFKFSALLSGLIWGGCGVAIVYFYPLAGITYIAHVLYWFHVVKLEYPNHAIAGVMILLGGFIVQGEFIFQHRVDLVLLYLAYTLSGYIQGYCKRHFASSYWFWRLRLRIYLIPLFYSFYHHDFSPFIATLFGMVGTEVVTYMYREYKDDLPKSHSPNVS